jgi:hypothetical protein
MHDDALANPTHISHHSPHRPAAESIDTRRNLNRSPTTNDSLHIGHARTDDTQNAPPHRFNFW